MGFLPEYILGAPTVPFIVCTIALGIIAVTAGGEESPILFLFCAIPGWLLAMFYRWGKWVFQNINWERLAGTAMTVSLWILWFVIAGIIIVAVAALLSKFWERIYLVYRVRVGQRGNRIIIPPGGGGGGGQPILRVPPNPNVNNRRN